MLHRCDNKKCGTGRTLGQARRDAGGGDLRDRQMRPIYRAVDRLHKSGRTSPQPDPMFQIVLPEGGGADKQLEDRQFSFFSPENCQSGGVGVEQPVRRSAP
jgi:hypothetical protein